jgi:hypothetical protein
LGRSGVRVIVFYVLSLSPAENHAIESLDLELEVINGLLLEAHRQFESLDFLLQLSVFIPQVPNLESLGQVE